ncbi:MAG: hypothetical protein HY552_00945 [Elusimicrobia bacterium]|nr:hypothetical protein [Elusimicrobiota bacterium]
MKWRAGVLTLALACMACSRRGASNYRHCLTLRVGMSREQLFQIMGPPAETFPYVEGKSLPHLAGRTAYEWPNPPAMPGPDHVSVSERTGKIESIRCSGAIIEAAVFVEPRLSTAAAAGSPPPARRPARRRALPRENPGLAPGRALTGGEGL